MKTEPTAQPSLEQMRVDVLEWMGLCDHPFSALKIETFEDGNSSDTDYTCTKCGKDPHAHPTPALTLDWLHECWLKLTWKQKRSYMNHIADEMQVDEDATVWDLAIAATDATAPQRLLALWRTINGL